MALLKYLNTGKPVCSGSQQGVNLCLVETEDVVLVIVGCFLSHGFIMFDKIDFTKHSFEKIFLSEVISNEKGMGNKSSFFHVPLKDFGKLARIKIID